MQIIAPTAVQKWTEVIKMGNTPCTRERILAVERILECSSKPLTAPAIVQKVKELYHLPADVKTIHSDIRALRMFYDIKHGGKKVGYYIADNEVEE